MYPSTSPIQDLNTMEMETEFRRRQQEVNAEILRRLDFHVQEEAIRRRTKHKHMLDWIESQVTESLKGKQVRRLGVWGGVWMCEVGWAGCGRVKLGRRDVEG